VRSSIGLGGWPVGAPVIVNGVRWSLGQAPAEIVRAVKSNQNKLAKICKFWAGFLVAGSADSTLPPPPP